MVSWSVVPVLAVGDGGDVGLDCPIEGDHLGHAIALFGVALDGQRPRDIPAHGEDFQPAGDIRFQDIRRANRLPGPQRMSLGEDRVTTADRHLILKGQENIQVGDRFGMR